MHRIFFARLPEAVERAVPSSEARDIILKQLVYENASAACQSVLRRVKKMGSISDYIRASMDIGPSYFQGVVIAATLQGCATTQFLNNQQQRQPNEKDVGLECFSCRHMGHISKRCPFQGGINTNSYPRGNNTGFNTPAITQTTNQSRPMGICPH